MSAKGTTWSNHKYIAIKNGRYIYPEEKSKLERLQKEKDNLEFDRNDEMRQNLGRTIDALVKNFNVEYLGRNPESLNMIRTDIIDEDGDPVYMEADEYLDYLQNKYKDYDLAIAEKEYKMTEILDEVERRTQTARR